MNVIGDVLVAGTTGLFTGAIGSLLTPWSKWAVEKSKKKRQNRERLAESWYAMINLCLNDGEHVLEQPAYLTLRPHLSKKTITELENNSNTIFAVIGARGIKTDPMLDMLLTDVQVLQKKWKLV